MVEFPLRECPTSVTYSVLSVQCQSNVRYERTTIEAQDPINKPLNSQSDKVPISKGLVLIVDDESMIGEVVQIALRDKGYRTRLFTEPEAAIDYLDKGQETPSLLLTDFLMPGMNGMDLIERCKAIHPDLKTVLYSGNVRQEITQYYTARPNRVLDKPFHPRMLVSTIEAVLAEK